MIVAERASAVRHQRQHLEYAHAVAMAREGAPLIVIGITSVCLQGIDRGEIIETVHARRAPMIAVSTSSRL